MHGPLCHIHYGQHCLVPLTLHIQIFVFNPLKRGRKLERVNEPWNSNLVPPRSTLGFAKLKNLAALEC